MKINLGYQILNKYNNQKTTENSQTFLGDSKYENKGLPSSKTAIALAAMLSATTPALANESTDTNLISNPRVVNVDFSKITKENFWQSLTPKQQELAEKIEDYQIRSLYRTGKTLPVGATLDVRYNIGLRGVGLDFVQNTITLYNTIEQTKNPLHSLSPILSPKKQALKKLIDAELDSFTNHSGKILILNRSNLMKIAKKVGADKKDLFFVGLVIQEKALFQTILLGAKSEKPLQYGNYPDNEVEISYK